MSNKKAPLEFLDLSACQIRDDGLGESALKANFDPSLKPFCDHVADIQLNEQFFHQLNE